MNLLKINFLFGIKDEYKKLREDHLKKKEAKNYLRIEEARRNKFKTEWNKIIITEPENPGNNCIQ